MVHSIILTVEKHMMRGEANALCRVVYRYFGFQMETFTKGFKACV